METNELKSFRLGKNWVERLYKKLKVLPKKRINELDRVKDIIYNDPLGLVKYYVEPNCQETNPADRHEEDFLVSSEPIYNKINEFLNAQNLNDPGNKQMFILSDSGMGKTSVVVILKLLDIASFGPKNTLCVLKIMGADTLDEIQFIKKKSKLSSSLMPLMKTRKPMDG